MSDLKSWSNSAAGNTTASPNGAPEGMAPSGVNDTIRECMAAVRRQHEDAEWINWGYTPSYATTASFTLAGDRTSIFHAGRRVKLADATTLYGKITSCSYSTVTRVSVSLDSGELAASLSGVSVGIISFTNTSRPDITASYAMSANSASAASVASFASSASSSWALMDGTNVIKIKIIDTGDWDMNATQSITVAHGLTASKIIGIVGVVVNDVGNTYYPLTVGRVTSAAELDAYIFSYDSTNITLARRDAGFYDGTDFDSTSYNRGKLFITYIE